MIIQWMFVIIAVSYCFRYIYFGFLSKSPDAEHRSDTCWAAFGVAILLVLVVDLKNQVSDLSKKIEAKPSEVSK